MALDLTPPVGQTAVDALKHNVMREREKLGARGGVEYCWAVFRVPSPNKWAFTPWAVSISTRHGGGSKVFGFTLPGDLSYRLDRGEAFFDIEATLDSTNPFGHCTVPVRRLIDMIVEWCDEVEASVAKR